METVENFLRQRLWTPLLNQLKQGITPEKLAWSVALGIVVGVFPVLGSTTILCALIAWTIRLNQPAIQTINYFVYPLQLILLIPFYRFGEWLFHVPPLKISVNEVRILIQASLPGAIKFLWVPTLHAMMAWCLVAPPIAWLIYLSVVPVLRRVAPAMRRKAFLDPSWSSIRQTDPTNEPSKKA